MFFKRLSVWQLRLPSPGPRSEIISEVGIVASFNTFAYDVLNFFYVQDLALASKMKMKKRL